MRFVFRADACANSGAGHVMRTSALAEELIANNYEVIFIGNFSEILTDKDFWTILERTLFFTFGMVAVSMIVGAWLAHLMLNMNPKIRNVLNLVLILVWAMPQLVSISVWRWLFSFEFSIITEIINNLENQLILNRNCKLPPQK